MCLRHSVEELQEGTRKPDFTVLFAILDYIEAFPDTYHHPKEEDYLFKALRRRRPDAALKVDAALRAALNASS